MDVTLGNPHVMNATGRRDYRLLCSRAAGWSVLLAALVLLTLGGLKYRRWSWDYLGSPCFSDITRNYAFGTEALQIGCLNLYDNQARDKQTFDSALDYSPMRTLTFATWVALKRQPDGSIAPWQDSYEFHRPLMLYYSAAEWLGAVAAMLIVWYWLRRCESGAPSGWRRAGQVVRAVLAFALLWFNPAVVFISHGWPSPNTLVIPFYLWAVLMCLWDRWFISGIVLAIGTMTQGQQFLCGAVFILWPIFSWRWQRLLRWTSGYALAFMLMVSPWMLSYRPDEHQDLRQIHWPVALWLGSIVLVLSLLALLRNRLPKRLAKWAALLAPALLLTWPALGGRDGWTIAATVGAAMLVGGVMVFASWRVSRYVIALSLAGALLSCVAFFDASTSWWKVGFRYGAERFPRIGGDLVANGPRLLEFGWRWQEIGDIVTTIPRGLIGRWPGDPVDVTARAVLLSVYGLLLILASLAIAQHWRRRSPRLLVALVLPWVLCFSILPQMSPRYAVFAAGVSAICIGQSVGMALLSTLFWALTIIQTSDCIMHLHGGNAPRGTNWLINPENYALYPRLLIPLIGAELLAAAVFLYAGLAGMFGARAARVSPQMDNASITGHGREARDMEERRADLPAVNH